MKDAISSFILRRRSLDFLSPYAGVNFVDFICRVILSTLSLELRRSAKRTILLSDLDQGNTIQISELVSLVHELLSFRKTRADTAISTKTQLAILVLELMRTLSALQELEAPVEARLEEPSGRIRGRLLSTRLISRAQIFQVRETMTQLIRIARRDQASLLVSVQNLVQVVHPCPVQAPTMPREEKWLNRGRRQAKRLLEIPSGLTSGIRRTLTRKGLRHTLKRAHSTVLARELASVERPETSQLVLLQDLVLMRTKH